MHKISILVAGSCALGAEARAQPVESAHAPAVLRNGNNDAPGPRQPLAGRETDDPFDAMPDPHETLPGQEPVGERPREPEPVEMLQGPASMRPYPAFVWGLEASIGGGVGGFTDADVRAATGDAAGVWTARVAVRTHRHLGLEVAYTGSAIGVGSQLGPQGSSTLVTTAFDGMARWTFLPAARVAPYAFVGLGYERFDMADQGMALSDAGLTSADNNLVFPAGAGVALRLGRAVLDVRGTLRAAAGADLVTVDGASYMHSWAASASVGYRL
jgi:hypothetical protein